MNMIERIATVVVVVDYDERLKILWIKKMNAMKWLVECKLNNDDSDEDDEEKNHKNTLTHNVNCCVGNQCHRHYDGSF